MAAWLVAASSVQAQDSTLKVAVLRATSHDAPGGLADAIDAALLRDLGGIAGIHDPTVSPVDYAEIQLAVGCQDESRACLTQIAQTVQLDAIVVRRVQSADAGGARLELVYFDASSTDEPARAEIRKQGAEASRELVQAVPSLVRKLFGIPETASAAEAAPAQAGERSSAPATTRAEPAITQDSGGVGAATWLVLGVGAVALTAGVVIGLSASAAFDEYKETPLTNQAAVRKANAAYDSAQSQGLLATILLPLGVLGLGVGTTLLVLDLSGDAAAADSGERAQLRLIPRRDGAMLTLQGSFLGAL